MTGWRTRFRGIARMAVRAVAAVLTIGVPAVAAPVNNEPGAPADQYETFTRTDLVVTDRKTRLVWARIVSRNVPFAQTADACLQRSELASVDRRLPTVKELLTLVDEFPHDKYDNGQNLKRAIDRDAFDGGSFLTPTDKPYWTSTDAGLDRKWVVDFTTGEVYAQTFKSGETAHVRCVRK
jgi:hypothetical protein